MFKKILFISLFFISKISFAISNEDNLEIQNKLENFNTNWNKNMCAGMAELYSEKSDFINIYGNHFVGNLEIENRHTYIAQNFLKDSIIKNDRVELKEITPDVIATYVNWTLTNYRQPGSDNTKPGETRSGIFTHIFHKENGHWLISTTQNTIFPK